MLGFLLLGADQDRIQRRGEEILKEAGSYELIDTSLDQGDLLIQAAASPSLFGPRRTLLAGPAEDISPENMARLVLLLSSSNAFLVLRGAKLTPTLKKRFAPSLRIEEFAPPKANQAKTSVRTALTEAGIVAEVDIINLIAERVGDDFYRVRSIARALALGGFTKPTYAQVELLVGTKESVPAPWDASAALEKGQRGEFLNIFARLSPLNAISYLQTRYLQALIIQEETLSAEAAAVKFDVKAFPAARLVELSKKFRPTTLLHASKLLVQMEIKAKSSQSLDKDLLDLSRLFGSSSR